REPKVSDGRGTRLPLLEDPFKLSGSRACRFRINRSSAVDDAVDKDAHFGGMIGERRRGRVLCESRYRQASERNEDCMKAAVTRAWRKRRDARRLDLTVDRLVIAPECF